jgi:FAD/FMN-containing dehydrogenase
MTASSRTAFAGVLADLTAQLPADRVLSGQSYEKARQIWNGAVSRLPAVIVQPESVDEVASVVRCARDHDLPLSVRGGGHDWAGRSLRDGAVVIDLSRMRGVVVDPEARTATLQGGATAGDVIAAARSHGLAAVTGTTGDVGMAGLTLGGGYGPLNGRFGLALDNLLGAELVAADGRRLIATAHSEPELYWALRGGGGNFGVVTSLRVQLHPVTEVLAGLIFFPLAQAADVWMRLNTTLAHCPDELSVQTGILTGPDDRPALFLSPVFSGDLSHGVSVIDELRGLGTSLSSQVASMSYSDMLALFDAQVVTGRHYAMRTRTISGYTADAVAALVDAGYRLSSPLSAVAIHHFHGAPTRVALEATAFGIRREHYVVEILAAWNPREDGARHRAWADSVAGDLAAYALPGGYANLLGPLDHEQIAHAYGPNAVRLRAAKKLYDPEGVFSAIPLPPAPDLRV